MRSAQKSTRSLVSLGRNGLVLARYREPRQQQSEIYIHLNKVIKKNKLDTTAQVPINHPRDIDGLLSTKLTQIV
jgi:hypothetical protein